MQSGLPEFKIPSKPEISMTGVVSQFSPVIMKTSLGGFIVVVPDKGVMARSTLEEAIQDIRVEAYMILAEQVPIEDEPRPQMPDVYNRWEDEQQQRSNALKAPRALQALAGMVFILASFMISKGA